MSEETKNTDTQNEDLQKLYDVVYNEKIQLSKENAKLKNENNNFKTQIDHYKKLEPFAELNPQRIDEYKQVDELLQSKNVEIEKIEKKYQKLVTDTRSEFEKSLKTEQEKSLEALNKFNSFKKQKILMENLDGLKQGVPKTHLIELLSKKFDIDDEDDNNLRYLPQEIDTKTMQKIKVRDAIDRLRDEPEYNFYFEPKTAQGSGAKGSSNIKPNGIWTIPADTKEAWASTAKTK